ncbi:hypothetical protein [Bartonella sp. LJL80]
MAPLVAVFILTCIYCVPLLPQIAQKASDGNWGGALADLLSPAVFFGIIYGITALCRNSGWKKLEPAARRKSKNNAALVIFLLALAWLLLSLFGKLSHGTV